MTLNELIAQLTAAGILTQAAVGLTVFAAVLSLVILIAMLGRAPSGAVRKLSTLTLFVCAMGLAVALVDVYDARDQALHKANSLRPALAEKLKRQSYAQSLLGLTAALPLALLPLVVGVFGLRVASRRRWSEYHEAPPPSPAGALLFLAASVAAWGYGANLWSEPLPGRALDEESWRSLEFVDALDANEWGKCLTRGDAVVPPHSAPIALGADKDSQRRCVDHFLQLPNSDLTAQPALQKLAAARWPDDPGQKTRIKERLAELPPTETVAATAQGLGKAAAPRPKRRR